MCWDIQHDLGICHLMTIDALFVIIIKRPFFFGPWPEGQANIVVVWKLIMEYIWILVLAYVYCHTK